MLTVCMFSYILLSVFLFSLYTVLTLIYEFICFYFDQLINGMFLFCLGMCGPFSPFRFMKQIRMEKRQNFLPQSLFHFHFLVNKKKKTGKPFITSHKISQIKKQINK